MALVSLLLMAPVVAPNTEDDPATLADAVAELHGGSAAAYAAADQEVAAARDRATALSDATTLRGALRAAVGKDIPFDPARVGSSASVEDSLAALALATDTPMEDSSLAGAGANLRAIAPGLDTIVQSLADALVAAAHEREAAMAVLDEDERARLQKLLASLPLAAQHSSGHNPLDALEEGSELEGLLEKIDLGRMVSGADAVLDAVDQVLPLLESLQPEPVPMSPFNPGCGGLSPPLIFLPTLLYVGGPLPESYEFDVILSIDLGGDDLYCNNAGGTLTTAPGINCAALFSPVALAIDVAGDDYYHSTYADAGGPIGIDASAMQLECAEGVGMTGVGVLVDVEGNDDYNSGKILTNGAPSCPVPPPGSLPGAPVGFTSFLSQGGGLGGVGVLADLYGQDDYNSNNQLCQDGGGFMGYVVSGNQGAGIRGVGLHLDNGVGDDNYNSHNELTNLNSFGAGNFMSIQTVQGAGTGAGIGAFSDDHGEEHYNSDNLLLTSSKESAVQDLEIACVQGCGVRLGVGVMAESLHDDQYNCNNQLLAGGRGSQSRARISVAQGAVHEGVLGVLVDGLGDDCYNSGNLVDGDAASLRIASSQGHASTLAVIGDPAQQQFLVPSVGILVDATGDDDYNSLNQIAGRNLTSLPPFPAFYPATLPPTTLPTIPTALLTIDFVQGNAFGPATVGVHVDGFSTLGDDYNSDNALDSAIGDTGIGGNHMRIMAAQGVGWENQGFSFAFQTPLGFSTALGVFADADSGSGFTSSDTYNSNNAGTSPFGLAGGIVIVSTNGASGLPFSPTGLIPGWGPGIGIMLEVGGSNQYNDANAFTPTAGLGACPDFPLSPISCIDWTHAVSPVTNLPAVFVDLTYFGPPDTYAPVTWSYGLGQYGLGPAVISGICVDAIEGFPPPLPEVPGPNACRDL